ncbi:membrane-bound lytic murein transglycosylase C [Rodentibacter pneumotropicus]|uniref:Membrane-bound lytic murein transglycosylase C n=1 Tax=Rodentibacter pneumotropicus TaxID=758 RepID=A0A3S4U7F5_9PAST|nr:membrane-bound lytic murein transglycosylase C [Rodentibacter pneumotropicus]
MKKYLLLALLPLLYACGDSSNRHRGINYDEVFAKDTQGLDILTGQFSHNIDRIWGSMSCLWRVAKIT